MNFGSIEAVAGKTAIDVLDTIRELGGLPVLAHADSSKGALRDMEGQQRIALMNSPAIAAVELNNIEKSGRFLDGTDPNFRRKLAVYRASDNRTPVTESGHSADGIAAKYSLFKMEHIDLRSLGQCFDDPDVRILPDVHAPPDLERPYPRILAVGISQGFLSGPGFSFHEGLNSIIGGKGTGKSLIVELIRFALDQPSSVSSIRDDYEGKLEAQLSAGGVVTLEVQLESSEVLAVERVYDGGQNPITVRYATSGKGVAGHIARLFR